jgi:two-component system, OmpR family, sensor kinase
MNTRSIGFRLTLLYAGLLLLVGLAFGAYSYFSLSDYLSWDLGQLMSHRARQIADGIVSKIEENGDDFVRSEIEARYAPELNDRFVRITRDNGFVVYTSGLPNDHSFDPGRIRPPTKLSQDGTVEIESRDKNELLIAAVSVVSGQHRYTVEAGASRASMELVLGRFLLTLSIGLPIVLGIATAGSFLAVKGALAPVKKIRLNAESIALKHLSQRLAAIDTRDEIAELSNTLNQIISRLEHSLRAASRFTADASHELRTPLTIISGELERLINDPTVAPPIRESLASLLEETEHLVKIVQSLLTLSRLDSGNAQTENAKFDLAELASNTAEQFVPVASEKQVSLSYHLPEPVEIQGDRVRLKQVIVNLLDNAIKYTPSGRKVDLRVEARDKRACLSVSDNGGGIPESELPYVFDRFFRGTHTRAQSPDGTGLGLSIVQSVCTAHGGDVTVENLKTGGCRFQVVLPLTKAK